jgi:crotonobetainyl-CoA:carnitine CoA-transferase CaiB-like acyl-CoA transferase
MQNSYLNNLKVLDISQGVAGPFCAKLLGDLGADVVKIEPPGGDISRQYGPFPDGVADPEKSASFFFFNTSKRGIVLDLESAAGKDALARLVTKYDVVIAGESEEVLRQRGLTYDTFRRWNPNIILTTISGFGSFGPHSEYQSSHLVAGAMGGLSTYCGLPDREPLQNGGATSETLTGAFAAVATSLAVFGRAQHGGGEHVDVSVQEAALACASFPTMSYEYAGLVRDRYSSVGGGAGACYMVPTREGYIGLNALTRAQWEMMCQFLGCENIVTDPYFEGVSWNKPDERLEEIREAFREAVKDRTAEDLFHKAQADRIPFGLVPDLAGVFSLPPHLERKFFQKISHPVAGSVTIPGIPFNIPGRDDQLTIQRPPLLGEHNDEILDALDSVTAISEKDPNTSDEPSPLPLKGLRVLDLSMFFAGPVCSQILADAGADVIKVESVQRIDGWRASIAKEGFTAPAWESAPHFNWVNRNKRDITLNLTDPRGVKILKRLVRDADVVMENYTPRVMDKFGLGFETLREIKPDIIMISLGGFGSDVTWRDYTAFGMSTEQMSGLAHLTGYEDDGPLFTGATGGDIYSGVMGAHVLLAALHERRVTGNGQHLNLSQMEACNLYVGDAMTGLSLAGVDPGRTGNKHTLFAPQGIYPCLADRWIGISCRTTDEWLNLANLIDPELATRFPDVETRQQKELDTIIGGWTIERDADALMSELQALGIAAGVVQNGPDLLRDPQLEARGSLLVQDRPGIGEMHYPNQPYRFRNAMSPPNVRAPLLGEHCIEVLTQEADVSDEELGELFIDDVIGMDPIASR